MISNEFKTSYVVLEGNYIPLKYTFNRRFICDLCNGIFDSQYKDLIKGEYKSGNHIMIEAGVLCPTIGCPRFLCIARKYVTMPPKKKKEGTLWACCFPEFDDDDIFDHLPLIKRERWEKMNFKVKDVTG